MSDKSQNINICATGGIYTGIKNDFNSGCMIGNPSNSCSVDASGLTEMKDTVLEAVCKAIEMNMKEGSVK